MWSLQICAAEEIEEVTVTAQKREQSLQSVPISVAAVTGDDLAERSVTNLTELASQITGLQYVPSTHGGSNATFYLRGVGQGDFIATTDPGVGVYVDGVYIARSVGGALELLDVERVEVLRGPQGTLFGKNTIGGAVNVVMRKPDFSTDAAVRLRVGERDRLNASASLNVPLVDETLAGRISFTSKSVNGYGRSLLDGVQASNEDTRVVRGALLWTPSAQTEVLLSTDWTHIDEEARHAVSIAVNPNSFVTSDQNAFALANGLEPFDERWVYKNIYENYAEYHPKNAVDIWGSSVQATWKLSDALSFKSISAYRNLKSAAGMDFDGSPSAISDQSVDDTQDQFSQELLLNGTSFGDHLEWVAGGYFQKEKGVNVIHLMLSYAENPVGFDTITTNEYSNTSYALYGQGTYHITDAFGLLAGVRYSKDKKEDTITANAPKFGVDLVPRTPNENSWNSTTYRVGLQYTLSEGTLAYLSNASGFKVGGFNGRPSTVGEFNTYAPEKVNTTELGLKTQAFGNRLRLDSALYVSKYTDIQATVNITDPLSGAPLNVVQNAARADISGLEVEGLALLGDFWELSFGAAYTDAEFKSLKPGTSLNLSDRLPLVPKWNGNVGLQFKHPVGRLGGASFLARADVLRQGDLYFNAQNTQYNFQKGYSLVNARIGVQAANEKWEVAAYGTNLGDKKYFQWMEDLTLFTMATGVVAPPREVGVELNFKW
ncbi:MAG: TonB-dependent receptor [Gammaproteobacteria bacterium]